MLAGYNNFSESKLFNNKLNIVCAFLIIFIFSIDILLPLGIAGGVPYIVVILFSLWSPNRNLTIYLAVICSMMTILGFYFSPPGGELWKIIVNRSLALFAIWITAILAIKWKMYKEDVLLLNTEMEKDKEKEKIYLATIYGAQHIINNLLNGLIVIEHEIEKHPDFDKEVSSLFNDAQTEAKKLINALSSVENIEDDAIRNSVYPDSNS